jgi:cysteine-rich repeat protein
MRLEAAPSLVASAAWPYLLLTMQAPLFRLRSITTLLLVTACGVDGPSAITNADSTDGGDTGSESEHGDGHEATAAVSVSEGGSTTGGGPSSSGTLNVFPDSTDPDGGSQDEGSDVDPSESSAGESSSSGGAFVDTCGDGIVDAGEHCDDGANEDGDFCSATCTFQSMVFSYVGAREEVVIPAWIDRMSIEVFGAQGGGSTCCNSSVEDDGGLGGWAYGIYTVVPGETLGIYAGGQGIVGAHGGFNGGGDGGMWAGGGGGASDVRRDNTASASRMIVAGGGGGGNCGCGDNGAGGPGGGSLGFDGSAGTGSHVAGAGGTPTIGGVGGSIPSSNGVFGAGGSGHPLDHVSGGGGGWYGGGGAYSAGGGGGSSWTGLGSAASTSAGMNSGDGMVVLTPMH